MELRLSRGGGVVEEGQPYVHALQGRLRINILGVKGSPTRALDVESRIGRLDGVVAVSANPLTGNVLIRYDDATLPQHALLATLRSLGLVRDATLQPPRPADHVDFSRLVARSVTQSVMELAVQGLIRALI